MRNKVYTVLYENAEKQTIEVDSEEIAIKLVLCQLKTQNKDFATVYTEDTDPKGEERVYTLYREDTDRQRERNLLRVISSYLYIKQKRAEFRKGEEETIRENCASVYENEDQIKDSLKYNTEQNEEYRKRVLREDSEEGFWLNRAIEKLLNDYKTKEETEIDKNIRLPF